MIDGVSMEVYGIAYFFSGFMVGILLCLIFAEKEGK